MIHNSSYESLDLMLRAISLSLLLNNGVHHLYINVEQVRHSELVLYTVYVSSNYRRTEIE